MLLAVGVDDGLVNIRIVVYSPKIQRNWLRRVLGFNRLFGSRLSEKLPGKKTA
jgi:hypothetical protein